MQRQANRNASFIGVFMLFLLCAYTLNVKAQSSNYIDTLNSRALSKAINIYDPDPFLKKMICDTVKLNEYRLHSEADKNYVALSFAYNMIGKNYLNKSNYTAAILSFKKAYEVALSINDEYLEALSLNMMGVVYRRKSAVKTALEYYTRALRTAERSDVEADYMLKSIAISNEGMGGVYRLLGQYESAIYHYKYSLRYEERLGSLLGLAINNHNIGKSFEYLGELDSAMYYHERSLEYNQRMNSVFGKAICYNSMAKVLLRQQKVQDAYQLLIPALSMAQQAGDSSYIVNSNLNMGWYHTQAGNNDSAFYYLQLGLDISLRLGNKSAISRAYELHSALAEQKNDNALALDYYKRARVYNDSIINQKNQQYLTDLTILYDLENKERTIEKLQYKAVLSKKIQQSKNVVIILLGVVALVLVVLVLQKIQAFKKNRVIHSQKESLYGMQLEMKALQNERLIAENKQKESEKHLLEEKLVANEQSRQREVEAMQLELDHKNRELAAAATYTIKKGESLRKLLDSIEGAKGNKKDVAASLVKLQREIETQMNPEHDWDNFSLHFEKVHPSFFRNLKAKHDNITANELRLCAYLLMNMSNKEIALLLYISNEAVQKAKYRLKKKFNLGTDDKLFDYLLSL